MTRARPIRYQLFLSAEVAKRFEAVAAAPGATKSAILTAAVAAFLARQGGDELEERFRPRLDRISDQLRRIERDGHVQIESLALFVRYMLAVNAPLAEEDEVARAIARDRFSAFVRRVGHQLASGRRTFQPGEPS